jgi:hypothetical protein
LKKRIKIADYQKVLNAMDTKKNKITFKGFENAQEWLKSSEAVLNAQTEYVHYYVEKANNLGSTEQEKKALQEKITELSKNPKMLGEKILKNNAMGQTVQNVTNKDAEKRLGSATSYAQPDSKQNSRPPSGNIFRISRENTQDRLNNRPQSGVNANILSSRLSNEQSKIDAENVAETTEYFDLKSEPLKIDNVPPKPHVPIIMQPKKEKSILELSKKASEKKDNLFKR